MLWWVGGVIENVSNHFCRALIFHDSVPCIIYCLHLLLIHDWFGNKQSSSFPCGAELAKASPRLPTVQSWHIFEPWGNSQSSQSVKWHKWMKLRMYANDTGPDNGWGIIQIFTYCIECLKVSSPPLIYIFFLVLLSNCCIGQVITRALTPTAANQQLNVVSQGGGSHLLDWREQELQTETQLCKEIQCGPEETSTFIKQPFYSF